MASESQIFNLSGPLHLTTIDWQNLDHQRSIAATLVQSVYVLECDRQESRNNALAPPWWGFFDFQLNKVLEDDDDHSIFGAIYEYKYHNSRCTPPCPHPPHYIIAFRGTLMKPTTGAQDLKLDIRVGLNRLQNSSRFNRAIEAVQKVVSIAGPTNVWLAGHSLGSAISLQVGRHMVKRGYQLKTYLFNPPFISTPTEQIKNKKLKLGVRISGSIIKAELANAVKSCRPNKFGEHEPFEVLSSWTPNLFLNPKDHICLKYIGYFDHREKMKELHLGGIERLATQNSFRSLFLGALGKELEPSHLIPSADLTINLGLIQDFRQAHGIEQWWGPNFVSHSKLHQFK